MQFGQGFFSKVKIMQKVKWRKQVLTIEAGSKYDQNTILIPSGKRVVAAAIGSKPKDQIINLGFDENGSEVETEMDLDFWKKNDTGKFLDGFKPLEYTGGSTLTLKLTATTDLTENFQVQVVFGIIDNDTTC